MAFVLCVYHDGIDDDLDADRLKAKLTKAMGYARRYELDRDDRIQLAEILLWRDVTSWKTLTEPELVRILDCMEGYALVTHLRWQKGNRAAVEPSVVSGC